MANSKLERTLAALPPELRAEVEDFAAFLLARQVPEADDATGLAHPLASLSGVWQDEPLEDDALTPRRSPGRSVDHG